MSGGRGFRQVDAGVAVTLVLVDGTLVDRRIESSGPATVRDLIHAIVPEATDDLELIVRSRAASPSTELKTLSLTHGDSLRIVRARKDHRGRPPGMSTQARHFLRQDDGRDRGTLLPIPASGLRVWLNKEGDLCRTKLNLRNPRRPQRNSMLLTDVDGGVAVESDDAVTIDGETVVGRGVAHEGSVIRLRSRSTNPDGLPWEITFVLIAGGTAHSTGWVPYRVVSEGKAALIALDESQVRLPAKPTKPSDRSLGDLLFELLPGLALVVLMGARGGSGRLYSTAFFVVYAARFVWQLRKRKEATEKYEKELKQWTRLRDHAVEAFSGHVVTESSVRSDLLDGALSMGRVWQALNRMPGLWGRGPDHPFFLHIRMGVGRWRSSAVFPIPGGLDHDESTELLRQTNALRTVDRAPIAISLFDDHCAVVGKSTAANRVLNLVLTDLAVNHSPLDLRIFALLPDGDEAATQLQDWLKWLPHVRTEAGVLPSDRIRMGKVNADEFLADLDARFNRSAGALADHPYVVGLIHEAVLPDQALVENLVRVSEGKVRILWFASAVDRVPALCSERVVLDEYELPSGAPATAQVDSHLLGCSTLPETPAEIGDYLSTSQHRILLRSTANASTLLELARSLAPLADDRRSFAGAAIPSVVPLSELVPLEGLPTQWHINSTGDSHEDSFPIPVLALRSAADELVVQLGIASGTLLSLDLVAGGPHMLVGGTTGSGKSEFLSSLIATTVARYDPGEVQLALIDFKGGAAFDAFSGLQHVVCEASNLEPDRMARAIDFLNGELDYRMGLLRSSGAKDFEELRRQSAVRHPRLLVVLDEYAAAQQSFPEVRRLTDTIAARGRSLGVHVVFATQNPANAVTADMVTNIGARVCLRMLHEADAKAVVFDEAPARIPLDLRGRAFLRTSEGSLIEFQSPFANAPVAKASARVALEQFPRV